MKEIFLDKNENAFDIPENLKYELMEYIKKHHLTGTQKRDYPHCLKNRRFSRF